MKQPLSQQSNAPSMTLGPKMHANSSELIQSSNLSLMIRDLISRQKKQVKDAEDIYSQRRNIRELIKKSSNDTQLEFELKRIHGFDTDQQQQIINRDLKFLSSRQAAMDKQAQTSEMNSITYGFSSDHLELGSPTKLTQNQAVFYHTTTISEKQQNSQNNTHGGGKRKNKFINYMMNQTERNQSTSSPQNLSVKFNKRSYKSAGSNTKTDIPFNYNRIIYPHKEQSHKLASPQSHVSRNIAYQQQQHAQAIKEQATLQQVEHLLQSQKVYYNQKKGRNKKREQEQVFRQEILTQAFKSIKKKLDIDKQRAKRIQFQVKSIDDTVNNVVNIMSRNKQSITLTNGTEWLNQMIERCEKSEVFQAVLQQQRVQTQQSTSSTTTKKEKKKISNQQQNRLSKHFAMQLRQILVTYKKQLNKNKSNQNSLQSFRKNRNQILVRQNEGLGIQFEQPKLKLKSTFSQGELYSLFTQFKTLYKISLNRNPQIFQKNGQIAIDSATFIQCVKSLMNFGFHTDQMLKRVFNAFDQDKNGKNA